MRIALIASPGSPASRAAEIAVANGADVIFCRDNDEAVALILQGRGPDMIMAGADGAIDELITSLASQRLIVPVVAYGAEDDAVNAVRAIKAGAREFVPLPPDPDFIAAVLGDVTAATDRGGVIYRSDAMAGLLALCDKIALSDAGALITGESGTGKEVIARYIHGKSARKTKRMVAVNCAAIPDSLLETELFGHEKGAFTGAVTRRAGKFEEADGSTLFLDEIGETAPQIQAKLLRAIQEKEIDRIGGGAPVRTDFRLLAASNRNLWEEAKKGNFREDLYYRLNVIHIHIPPLRERPDDIMPLAEYFLERYAKANGGACTSFNEEAVQALEAYDWPGNVRELENTVHRAVLLSAGAAVDASEIIFASESGAVNPGYRISAEATAAKVKSAAGSGGVHAGKTIAQMERELILQTMEHCYGNRTKAAETLGISIRTLRNKLKEYDYGAAV